MKRFTSVLFMLITFGTVFPVYAMEGESIVFDPATGNYLITYMDSRGGEFDQVTFIPATKINPAVKIKLKHAREGVLNYRYTLSSGQDSQQSIVHIILDPVTSVSTSLPDIPLNAPPGQIAVDMLDAAGYFETPSPWDASMAYSDENEKTFRIGWRTKVVNGLLPGAQATFSFNSRDLPGIIQAEIYGYAPGSEKIPGEETQDAEDGGFGQQYTELVFKNNFVRRFVAVPTIPVTTPFDAVNVLSQLKSHLMTLPGMKLLDTAAAATIATGLQAAIDALNAGNKAAAVKALKSLSPEIAKTDKELVKGVLKFDVKFVAKMLGSDEPEEDEVSFSSRSVKAVQK